MQRIWKRYWLWSVYAVFLTAAMVFGAREGLVLTDGAAPGFKYLIFVAYVGFLAYSVLATARENFFRTLGVMGRLWWGRQVGLDLYISMALSLVLIWAVEGSVWALLFWLVPVLIFANLTVLPFILLNYAEIAGLFVSG